MKRVDEAGKMPIPGDAETEACIIGACLSDSRNLPIIIGRLCTEDFLSPMNRVIFAAIKSLYEKEAPVDLLTLRNELRMHRKEIRDSKIVEIQDSFIQGISLEHHVQHLKVLSKKRKLLLALEEIKDPSIEFQDIVANIKGILDDCHAIEPFGLKVLGPLEILNFDPPKFLVKPFLYRGTLNILAGASGKGKTILTYSIMKAILTGRPWLERFPVISGPVLLVDEETPASFLRDRFERIKIGPGLPLHILHFKGIKVDREDSFQNLLATIHDVKPIFVVFDSLTRLHTQKESDTAMARVMNAFRRIANEGATVWIIHHHKKGDAPLDQKTRGSTDIVAAVDIEFSLTEKEGILAFSSVKSRIAPFDPIQLRLEASDTEIKILYQGTDKESIIQEIMDILRDREPLAVTQILGALKDRRVAVGINRFRSILKGATARKEIIAGKEKAGKSQRLVYSLNGASQLTFNASPLTNKGVKPLSDPLTLNGQAEKESQGRETLTHYSEGFADDSRVGKQTDRDALKGSIDASYSGVKNRRGVVKTSGEFTEFNKNGQPTN